MVVTELVRRVEATLAQSQGRFPVHADPVTGEWTWSEDGDWCGGFWGGLLSLAAVATGDPRFALAAGEVAGRLAARTDAPTLLRGLLFWYGAALPAVLAGDEEPGAPTALAAAQSLSIGFDPLAGLLPPQEEDVAKYGWPRPGACVDGLPGTVPLLAFASERTGARELLVMAESHARACRAICVREDGSVAQTSTGAVNGSSPGSTWARAQAWAMLGLAQAAHLSPEFTEPAAEVADWYTAHVPSDLVCYWDFDDPGIPDAPRDTSATAIAAAALAKLAPLAKDGYREQAADTLAALARDHLNEHGGLVDGCYNRRKGLAVGHELIWGDYFLLEAALVLDGAIDTSRL
ncbi:glycoside hydrolase family 88 protein [Nonomuraea spiralis]|uniref:glycoside hydrolase family 88 protein n=1 Tax=Nonomuraea TaxID=83681 RepID=UPI000F7A0DA0|nr:glycoside hydrolase family 88 protein [Nonomuraea sp. WAC 01424]RSM97583.1 glucuronyl hydrolase [Nonomuraea sp. WAC 01424]